MNNEPDAPPADAPGPNPPLSAWPAWPTDPAADPLAAVADAVEGLREEMAGLGERFRQRLLTDRETRKALEQLQAERDASRKAAEGRIVQPLLYDLILILDRIEAFQSHAAPDPFTRSVADELVGLLEKYGIRRLPQEPATPFDPARQEAVATRTPPAPGFDGIVAEVTRRGYALDDRVIRPQQVHVFRDH